MKIQLSSKFRINKLSRVERKLVRKRIKELEACKNLGEMNYGRVHPLRAKYSGAYGVCIGKMSRLILFPIELDPEYINRNGKTLKHYVVGIVLAYSPNHYRNYFWTTCNTICYRFFFEYTWWLMLNFEFLILNDTSWILNPEKIEDSRKKIPIYRLSYTTIVHCNNSRIFHCIFLSRSYKSAGKLLSFFIALIVY